MVTKEEALAELQRRRASKSPQGKSVFAPIMPAVEGFNLGVETTGRGLLQTGTDALEVLGFLEPKYSQAIGARQELAEREFEKNYGPAPIARTIGELGALAPFAPLSPAGPVLGGLTGGFIEQFTRPQKEEVGMLGRLQSGAVGGALGAAGGKAFNYAGKMMMKTGRRFSDLFTDIFEEGFDETQAFRQVKTLLGDEAEKAGRIVRKNYEKAKELGEDAFIPESKVSEFISDIANRAGKEIDDDARSALSNIVNRLDDLRQRGGVTVNEMQSIRRSASRASKRGLYAAGEAARDIDDFIIDALPDDNVGKVWKEAIKSRREFAQKFEDPAEIAYALTDEPLEAVEAKFFSRGTFNPKAARIYDDVVKAVPQDQAEKSGFLMRQSIVNKMIKDAAGKVDDPDGVSGVFLANRISGLRKNNTDLWGKFKPDEQELLNNLEATLRKEAKGGFVNKTAEFLTKFLSRASGSNIELPRTIKPKTIYTLDDLMRLTKTKPTSITNTAPAGAAASALGTLSMEE